MKSSCAFSRDTSVTDVTAALASKRDRDLLGEFPARVGGEPEVSQVCPVFTFASTLFIVDKPRREPLEGSAGDEGPEAVEGGAAEARKSATEDKSAWEELTTAERAASC